MSSGILVQVEGFSSGPLLRWILVGSVLLALVLYMAYMMGINGFQIRATDLGPMVWTVV